MQSRAVSHVMTRLVLVGGALFCSISAHAGEADVVAATATKTGENTYRFDVTVAHDDTGWDHYANVWQVIGPDDAIIGERVRPISMSMSSPLPGLYPVFPSRPISPALRSGPVIWCMSLVVRSCILNCRQRSDRR